MPVNVIDPGFTRAADLPDTTMDGLQYRVRQDVATPYGACGEALWWGNKLRRQAAGRIWVGSAGARDDPVGPRDRNGGLPDKR
jgi:hypothetical protein